MDIYRFQQHYGITVGREEYDELRAQAHGVLLSSDREQATQLVERLEKLTYPLAFLELSLLIPALLSVIEDWFYKRRPYADVTAAWAQAEYIIPELASRRLAAVQPVKPRILVSLVEGNQHELGARVLADLLAEARYRVDYVTPPATRAEILRRAGETAPACIALSVSVPAQGPEMLATVDALRQGGYAGKIAVGGSAVPPREPADWQRRRLDWIGTEALDFIRWLDLHVTAPGAEREAA